MKKEEARTFCGCEGDCAQGDVNVAAVGTARAQQRAATAA
jgi:hypothetical protein